MFHVSAPPTMQAITFSYGSGANGAGDDRTERIQAVPEPLRCGWQLLGIHVFGTVLPIDATN